MGLLTYFKSPDIDSGMTEWRSTPGAILLDVRTRSEYRSGHIPGSVNLPLQDIDSAENVISDKSTPIFVYCQSGARSASASNGLRRIGYSVVKNIGGLNRYSGNLER